MEEPAGASYNALFEGGQLQQPDPLALAARVSHGLSILWRGEANPLLAGLGHAIGRELPAGAQWRSVELEGLSAALAMELGATIARAVANWGSGIGEALVVALGSTLEQVMALHDSTRTITLIMARASMSRLGASWLMSPGMVASWDVRKGTGFLQRIQRILPLA